MKETKTERKESTKRCCSSGWRRRDTAERDEEGGALIGVRMTENNLSGKDRQKSGLMEQIVPRQNLNAAYKRVKGNKGAGGSGMVRPVCGYRDRGAARRPALAGHAQR